MKSSTQLEQEVRVLDEGLTALRTQMDHVVERFAGEVVPHAIAWIEGEIRRSVERSPKEIEELSDERLSAAKSQVAALKVDLPRICGEAVLPVEQRPHNATRKPGTYSTHHDYFSEAFRTIVSHVGTPLKAMGVLATGHSHCAWVPIGNGRFRYEHSPGLQFDELPTLRAYGLLKKQFDEVLTRMANATSQLASARARERWERS